MKGDNSMKRSTFMLIAAIIGLLFGLGFILIPDTAMSIFGSTLDAHSRFMSRTFGSTLLGVAVTFWTTRNFKDLNEVIKGVLLGGFALGLIGFIVQIWDFISGVSNNIWITIIIYGFLSIGFGYYYFKKPV
jgi:hypothetical protein